MTRLETVLRNICQALNTYGHDFALVGGMAVSARAEPRFTRDIDFAVAVANDRAAEAIVHDMGSQGYQVLATVEQDATHRLATVRLLPEGETPEGILVDLLFASSGIEPELVRGAGLIELLPGFAMRIASVAHLLALKVLSVTDGRPQDLVDIRSLLASASETDVEQARDALRLIDQRGFGRGKNLMREFERLVSSRVTAQ